MADLQSHGLQLLAADRWRRLGRAVPADVAVEELWAAAKTAATDEILARVRAACEGRLLVLKGPEVAAHYPTRTLRPSADLDILAEDATETQAALVAAGFERVGAFDDDYYEGLHHLRPLRRLLDIIDVAAVAAADSRDGANTLAARWGLSRMWKATLAAANAVLFDERTPWSLRMWARDLPSARDRSVFEDHLRRWLSPFWALPPHRAVAAALQALVEEVSPASNETWGNKLVRVREALLNPWRPSAEHAGRLGREGVQPRHRRR